MGCYIWGCESRNYLRPIYLSGVSAGRMVKDLVMINDYSQIKQVVSVLVHDFTLSSSANTRKGGLVGLAATAIALGRVSPFGGRGLTSPVNFQ